MEKYQREGKWFEREYDEDGILIYDSYDDYDETREDEESSSQYYDGYYDPEHRYPVINKTEYDDEGYEVAQWIPTMKPVKTQAEIEADERKNRWVSIGVVVGCLLFILLSIGVSYIIVNH